MQPGPTLSVEPVDPVLHALARDTHRGRDVRLGHAGLVALNDQQPTMNGQPGITVGHENLRVEWALDKPHPTRRFSYVNDRLAATNVLAGYN